MIAALDKAVADSEKAGALKPVALDLAIKPEPQGRFLFPGKLKTSARRAERWALADGGHNQIVLLDDAGKELARYGSGEVGSNDGSKELACFHHPQGLTASSDAIFVADTENNDRKIDLAFRRGDHVGGNRENAGCNWAMRRPRRTTALAIAVGPRDQGRPALLRERRNASDRCARPEARHRRGARRHRRGRYSRWARVGGIARTAEWSRAERRRRYALHRG